MSCSCPISASAAGAARRTAPATSSHLTVLFGVDEWLHVATLDGLKPGVEYQYNISGGFSSAFTAGREHAAGFTFAVYGDLGTREWFL